MCGIVGFFSKNINIDYNEVMKSMLDSIIHRGPDDGWQEYYQSPNFGLLAFGHRRLSIIDLSLAGRQPMTSNNGVYSIVFNGEIYNYKALRKKLEAEGYRLRTQTDTEVIL
ncbi:MAG: asparagine synthetase B, partial [Bacillota bacterium]|nr:asparagine synthetase B [Bacillota bacterium]